MGATGSKRRSIAEINRDIAALDREIMEIDREIEEIDRKIAAIGKSVEDSVRARTLCVKPLSKNTTLRAS